MTLSILHLRSTATEGPTFPMARSTGTTARRRLGAPTAPRIALGALLALTALAYIWNLGASGDANSFYAAAVQAGTESWKAFFFGSLDKANFITVDKPPASLWVMELSGRVFGFSSWSMLVPEALEGVAAVALLAAAVRRWFGEWAGIAAGAVFALTPVAALMFRFNNPDALLVLLLVASAYSLTRALERGATRWILAAGALLGFAFLAKMLQAFLVLPGFALVYLVAAPGPLTRRVWQTLAAGAAIVIACGWWLLAVALWPVADRPMIDGSASNNIFNLIFGYNGLGRVFGGSGDGGAGGHGIGGGGIGSSFSGSTGLLRLFNSLMGGQASWLLPAALIALVAGLIARRRAPRTDRVRAALLLWGSWLVVTALVFSESSGIIHTYYTVALAPAIGALVAIGGRQAWQHRASGWAQATVGVTIAVTAAWAEVLLARTASWHPWLATVVLAAAVIALGLLAVAALPQLSALGASSTRRLASAGAVLALVACMAGPVAYTFDTVSTAHTGSVPSAGPSDGARGTFGGGSFGRGGSFGHGGFPGARTSSSEGAPTGGSRSAGAPGARTRSSTTTGFPGGRTRGGSLGGETSGVPGGGMSGAPGGGTASVSAALRRALESDAGRYRWVAATSGSQSAASYELATGGQPVMAIGGFSGEGGNLTLARFQSYVKAGQIHYYIASGGGMGGGPGRGGASSSIQRWVASHYTKQTIGGTTVYNLTLPKATS
ncbi:MAG TPA: glycosyltransferase family 39 protein [Solirubrobacteraceae bacterium]|nr:glycosyltransferase family 39 protein [Solirubrobacteraceae bacterium]